LVDIQNSNLIIKNSKTSSNRLDPLTLIMMCLAVFVIAWMNNGIFSYVLPHIPNFIRWGIFLAWFFLAITSNKKFAKTFIVQCWSLLLFLFYILFLYFFINKDARTYPYILAISFILMVYSIFLYYFNDCYKKFQKVLIVFLSFDCIFVAISTYRQLRINPLIARYLATGIAARDVLLGITSYNGVGSYGYFYGLVSIILLLGFLLLNYNKRKLLIFILFIAFLALLIQASFTIAILFTFIFLALLIILRYTSKNTSIAIVLLAIMTFLLFRSMIASMFIKIANINGISLVISVRLNELSNFFSGNNISGTDLFARKYLYLQSINAFVNNILTGISPGVSGYSIGGHSAWLDLFFVSIYWLYFICVGFIDTLFMSNIFTTWFLFLPVVINIFPINN
jgi:hypothetical protein